MEWELQFEIYAGDRAVRSEPVPVLVVQPIRPAREILEGVVASVLEALGFEARTNVKKWTVYGSPIEVDVWAEGEDLTVYVSCKNREEPIGADVIHQEAGRVSSLREEPDLKVIVAPSFTENAKAAARAKRLRARRAGYEGYGGERARGLRHPARALRAARRAREALQAREAHGGGGAAVARRRAIILSRRARRNRAWLRARASW